MLIHSNGQILSNPKSRADQLLAAPMPPRTGFPDGQASHQLAELTRNPAAVAQEEQQRRLQVPRQARIGQRSIANAMYESALASVAQNCGSKLTPHLSLPVEEEGRNKFHVISSAN